MDEDPEYYEEVKTPISLEVIASKASRGECVESASCSVLSPTFIRDLAHVGTPTRRQYSQISI